jgi:DNA polymerase III subunit alpha, Gram-positive type
MIMLPTLIGIMSFYVVFDLETTGRSRQKDKIIELAAVILDCLGVEIEDAFFSEFVKPTKPIPPFITELY